MKNVIQTFILAVFCLLLAPTQSFGQLYEVSLNEKIEKSTLIVEGKVVETQTYKAEDGTIYTSNKIELLGVLKGEYRSKDLYITTWGGEYEGELQTWTHLLTLSKGDYGLFFLEPTHVPISKTANADEVFDVYSASQGYVAFVQNDAKAWIGVEPFHTYEDVPKDLYGHIEKTVGQKMVIVNKGGDTKRSGIRYHFTDIDFDGTTITFVINVNSLVGEKKLYQSGIQFGYNPAFFGANIATNGNLQLQNVGISALNTYNLTKSNVSSSKVKIELLPSGSIGNIAGITVNEQILAKGSISIQNFLADPGIIYNLAEMQSMSKYYDVGGQAVVFDTVVVDGDWRSNTKIPPFITSFEPDTTTAGISEPLTIKGVGFGNIISLPPTDRKVVFTRVTQANSPNGQIWMTPLLGEYLLWNDSTIIVQVPSIGFETAGISLVDYHAGTGKIGVITPDGTDTIFPKKLYVRGTAFNNEAMSPNGSNHGVGFKFINRNLNGGNDLYFTQAFSILNAGNAKEAFKRALLTWRCATGINFRTKLLSDIPLNIQKYACQISIGVMPNGVFATSTAITFDSFDICAQNNFIKFFQVRKFNIIFNSLYSWHTSLTTPVLNWQEKVDLETTALHELGHAHEIGHSNNSHNVMWFKVDKYKRNLTSDDIYLGNYIVFYSSADTIFKCTFPMVSVLGIDCGVLPIKKIENKILLVKTVPNPVLQYLSIEFPDKFIGKNLNLKILDAFGRRIEDIENVKVSENTFELDMRNYQIGIYFIVAEIDNENPLIVKVIKQ
jgi:hypothetical protein